VQGHEWSRGVLLLTMCFALVLTPALESPLRKLLIARRVYTPGITGLWQFDAQ